MKWASRDTTPASRSSKHLTYAYTDLEAGCVQPVSSSVEASRYSDHLCDALLLGACHSLVKPLCACIDVVCCSWGSMFGMLCDMLKSKQHSMSASKHDVGR